MSVERELAQAIHGIVLNRGRVEVVCDLPHDTPEPIDTDRRLQYECIRVTESVTYFDGLRDDWYNCWHPDLLRCRDCEISSFEAPTEGFDEALVEIDVVQSDSGYLIDARDMRVIEYSPADDGQELPPLPRTILKSSLRREDPGAIRRSRLARSIEHFRQHGADDLAQAIEDGLAGEF